jgi:hypothetical protein
MGVSRQTKDTELKLAIPQNNVLNIAAIALCAASNQSAARFEKVV